MHFLLKKSVSVQNQASSNIQNKVLVARSMSCAGGCKRSTAQRLLLFPDSNGSIHKKVQTFELFSVRQRVTALMTGPGVDAIENILL